LGQVGQMGRGSCEGVALCQEQIKGDTLAKGKTEKREFGECV